MTIYVIQKIGGNEISPDSLNVMVNYHYHSEKRVITWQFPFMEWSEGGNKVLPVIQLILSFWGELDAEVAPEERLEVENMPLIPDMVGTI